MAAFSVDCPYSLDDLKQPRSAGDSVGFQRGGNGKAGGERKRHEGGGKRGYCEQNKKTVDLCCRKRSHGAYASLRAVKRKNMESGVYNRRSRGLCECRGVQGAYNGDGNPLHRQPRQKGRKQCGRGHSQRFDIRSRKDDWKMKYGLKEIATMSIGANVGGISVSSIGKSKREKEKKYNEGIFQILNSILPMSLVDGGIKLCEKSKKLNNAPAKIAASTIGVVAGTQLGIKLANKITDPKDLRPDRRYTAKDAIANIDDAVSILVLGKVPFADKIHIEKALPFIYGYSGYRSGTSN